MARKQLPYDFLSWVNLYDFLKARDPRAEKFTFKMLDQVTLERTEYSITMTTVAKYAWEEIQQYRLSNKELAPVYHALTQHWDNDSVVKANNLLLTLRVLNVE